MGVAFLKHYLQFSLTIGKKNNCYNCFNLFRGQVFKKLPKSGIVRNYEERKLHPLINYVRLNFEHYDQVTNYRKPRQRLRGKHS